MFRESPEGSVESLLELLEPVVEGGVVEKGVSSCFVEGILCCPGAVRVVRGHPRSSDAIPRASRMSRTMASCLYLIPIKGENRGEGGFQIPHS